MQNYMKKRFDNLLKAAEICDREGLDMPALILLYSLIDSLAWVVYEEELSKVGERFEKFCDEFVLPGSGLPCSAKELYSARCSSLHLLGWESNLTKHKGVRALFYSYQDTDLESAQRVADLIFPGKFVGIRALSLHAAIKAAIDRVIKQSRQDSKLEERLR